MKKIISLLLVSILALSVAIVGAQDEQSEMESTTYEGFRVLVQEGLDGSFTEVAENTYTLELTVGELGDALTVLPLIRNIDTINLVAWLSDWANIEGLSAPATLTHENGFVDMTLSAPSYDAETGTVSFTATVGMVLDAAGFEDKAEVPTEFSGATLVTEFSVPFETEIVTFVSDETRAYDCDAAISTYNQLVTTYNQMRNNPFQRGTLQQLDSQIRALQANMNTAGCVYDATFISAF